MKIDILFYDLEKKAGIQKAIADLLSELALYQEIDLRLILFRQAPKFSFEIPECVEVVYLDIPEGKSQCRFIQLLKKLCLIIHTNILMIILVADFF